MKQFPFAILLTLLSSWAAAQAGGSAALSEKDFLDEMPVVLSVSRLAQPIDEAPGAVTVLDRAFILMTGARDVADILRLVPGFQTTTAFETDATMASYHGRNDDWSNRIQVLVDGRSVYSGHLQGSSGLGLETLTINDIERIEVLRGSNSAAYGARAFLGVINIISRDVRETSGTRVRLNGGDGGVADAYASWGWGNQGDAYRLSIDTRGDMGLRGAYGVNRVSRLNFSSSVNLLSATSLEIRAGSLGIDAGRGEAGSPGNVSRSRFLGSQFLQADLLHSLTADQDLQIGVSQTENSHRDQFLFFDNLSPANFQGVPVAFSAFEVNQVMTLQHTARWNSRWRTVWGLEFRKEAIESPSSFDERGSVSSNFQRLFGSAEWRIQPSLLLNSGVMLEQSDLGGGAASPRLMLNWHVTPGHTLRAGVSTAFRPPSAYEKYAAVRYYDANHQPLQTTVLSSGNLVPEKIQVRELGYNLNWPAHGLAGDLRLFDERISDGIERPAKVNNLDAPDDYSNIDNYRITGAEHQLQWRPHSSARVLFTQTWTRVEGAERFRVTHSAARYAMSLSGQYTTPGGYVLSVMHAQSEDVALMSDGDERRLYTISRTDARLAKGFKLGQNKAEVALTLQNLGQPSRDGDKKFMFDRRAFVTLQVEH